MTENADGQNPFLGLIEAQSSQHFDKTPSETELCNKKINDLIEKIFLFTINKNGSSQQQAVFLEEIANMSQKDLIDIELLEQAVFERLLLNSPDDFLVPSNKIDEHTETVIETKVTKYLYRAFEVCENSYNNSDPIVIEVCKASTSLIIRNMCTAIRQPELFATQTLSNQWLEILRDPDNDYDIRQKFLISVTKEIVSDNFIPAIDCLKTLFYPMFTEIKKSIKNANLINLGKWVLPLLTMFVSDKQVPELGELLIDFITPNIEADGVKYTETLLGHLLNLSILPKSDTGPYEYYENPKDALIANMSSSLWNHLTLHLDKIHTIFKSLLLFGGSVKNKTLNWFGNCLNANKSRGQLWNAHSLSFTLSKNASDGFMIGLCGILLRLSIPLNKPSYKVLLVDPTYCAVPDDSTVAKNIHMKKLSEETFLLPKNDDEKLLMSETYNFITECFYMTHKAIDLGFRVCFEKFIRMNRDMHRFQLAYQDAAAQDPNGMAQNMLDMLKTQQQQFLCLKTCIMEPYNELLLLQFYEATASWLTEICNREQLDIDEMVNNKCFAPKQFRTTSLLSTSYVPQYLKSIPEFVLENIVHYLTFIRNFEQQDIEVNTDAQNAIFRTILVFMGSVERARNPHLRARLAEGLESFLPIDVNQVYNNTLKTKVFDQHPDRLHIVPKLLDVFVSIEMTGQSVQFEQKFNYRRPMYSIMNFLWKKEEQKECFRALALEAEKNMEAVEPPIFLRFINLLINDAIFLLDESLTNLQQIRTLQHAQDNGEWTNLPENERRQNVANLQHIGMMARFDNILARDTINILKLITSEIKEIFCHASMVDRIASMLNYFLLNLVGPKKGTFKVKDKSEFSFDPANTVLEICHIYINLKENEDFCLAVSQDGRSYSNDLFEYAEQVLIRIGGGQMIGEMSELATKVKRIEKAHRESEEALADAPNDYLDPIMSTLMVDPVILPSSKVTVDKTTIVRHLLSDQTDPFNRSPLTMDQVIPNVELKAEIEQWILQKRKEYREKNEL